MWVATCSFKNLLSLWMTRYQRLIPITRQVLPFCLVTIWRNCFLFAPCLPKLRVSLRVVARKSDHTISLATSHHDGHWNDIVTFRRYNRKTSIPNFSFRFETKTVHLEFIPMRLVTARFSPSKTRMTAWDTWTLPLCIRCPFFSVTEWWATGAKSRIKECYPNGTLQEATTRIKI